MDEIEKLQRNRNRLLIVAAISFLLWQGATLGIDIAGAAQWTHPISTLVMQISLIIGAVAWAGAMLMLVGYQRAVRQAGACTVLRDELFLRHRTVAILYGFTGMVAVAALLLAVSTFVEFSAEIAIRAVLISGVSIPLVMLVRLERKALPDVS